MSRNYECDFAYTGVQKSFPNHRVWACSIVVFCITPILLEMLQCYDWRYVARMLRCIEHLRCSSVDQRRADCKRKQPIPRRFGQQKWTMRTGFLALFRYIFYVIATCYGLLMRSKSARAGWLVLLTCAQNRAFSHHSWFCTVSRVARIDRNERICIPTMYSIYIWNFITVRSPTLAFTPHLHRRGSSKTQFSRERAQEKHCSSSCVDQNQNTSYLHRSNIFQASIKTTARESVGHTVFTLVYSDAILQKSSLSHHFAHYSRIQCPPTTFVVPRNT